MTSDAAPDTFDETSVPGLWETARWFFRWLVSICGDPCALVAECWLSRKERREIHHWLRPVEAIARRLLIVEAARIALTPRPERGDTRKRGEIRSKPWRPGTGAPFCRVSFPDPEDSTRWSVRFSCFEPGVRRPATAGTESVGPRIRVFDAPDARIFAAAALAAAAAEFRKGLEQSRKHEFPHTERPKPRRAAGNPWVLARRIEALARVLENPQPYARRLARRLGRHAAHLARICRPPPRRPGRRPR